MARSYNAGEGRLQKGMSEKAAEKIVSGLALPKWNDNQREVIKNEAKRLLVGGWETDFKKFEDARAFEGTGGMYQYAAYLALADAGKLPQPKYKSGDALANDNEMLVELANDLASRIGKGGWGMESAIAVDGEGRIIGMFKGERNEVGGNPSLGDPIVQRDGLMRTIYRIRAGGGQVHNHPYGKEFLSLHSIGCQFSGGDYAHTIANLHAFGVVTTSEGTYVMRNKNWKEDRDFVENYVKTKVNEFEKRSGKTRYFKDEIDNFVKNAYEEAAGFMQTRALSIKAGISSISEETFSELIRNKLLPDKNFNRMNTREAALYVKVAFDAQKKWVSQYGIEIDFIPNKGFENMMKDPNSVPND